MDYDTYDKMYDLVMKCNDDVEKHIRSTLNLSAYESLMVACEMAKVYALMEKR